MMYYIESPSTDPYFNLALEQYVFDRLDRRHRYCMLWQNHNAIIVGKYQNTAEEIDAGFVKDHGISVVRRLSGGGAVYHDLGNLNFTFIADSGRDQALDFSSFCLPIAEALASLGVAVELSGRNDMTIDGKKFSGNSQYRREGRVMHHGTILFDSDLEVIGRALRVPKDKIQSKGVQSVRSRVTNVRPYLAQDIPIRAFWDALLGYLTRQYDLVPYALSAQDLRGAEALRDGIYRSWAWNYGASPAYTVQKSRRVEGCGRVDAYIQVGKRGVLEQIAFRGDFFSGSDPAGLAARLKGCRLEESALRAALSGVAVGQYFHGMELEDFLAVLLQ